jgi:phosphatidylserine/phosphatidylglycerophosphate/cardiolipin synthase-like enzyme
MEILFGPEIPVRLVRQIEKAKKTIVLVSPYFDPWHHLTMAVRNAITVRGVKVVLILRGGKDRAQQEAKARPFADMGVTIKFVERLHAKLYICDDVAFLTSLNLLRSSQEGSYELASIIDRKSDPRAFNQLNKVIPQLVNLVEADDANTRATSPAPKAAPRARRPTPKKTTGFCLRCQASIQLDPKVPYCKPHLKSWSKWKNPDYAEKHCHSCGKETETSLNRPVCKPCYRKSH